ncbi:MAG: indole-3-glycerol phosphate synthase TrpC [bacterium]|nr:indole-3-glycerol phosphate synthase TrpC [bacterium]
MILDDIVKNKRKEIEEKKRRISLEELKSRVKDAPSPLDFKRAVTRNEYNPIKLIAEIKGKSPSMDPIEDLDPKGLAVNYELSGASAISVVTDNKFFKGSLDILREVKQITNIPVLSKDFIIDPYQIYESRCFQADSILLIASILNAKELKNFLCLARDLGMSCVVEVHSDQDLDKALSASPEIIGVNNRSLYTFLVDLNTTLRLKPQIPRDKTIIGMSGVKQREYVELLEEKGVDAVLVGEALLRSKDPGRKIKELLGKDV